MAVAAIAMREARALSRAKANYREAYGLEATTRRAREIAALKSKRWRGRRVYLIWCQGDFGVGIHKHYKPAVALWHLMDLGHYKCPYH